MKIPITRNMILLSMTGNVTLKETYKETKHKTYNELDNVGVVCNHSNREVEAS